MRECWYQMSQLPKFNKCFLIHTMGQKLCCNTGYTKAKKKKCLYSHEADILEEIKMCKVCKTCK